LAVLCALSHSQAAVLWFSDGHLVRDWKLQTNECSARRQWWRNRITDHEFDEQRARPEIRFVLVWLSIPCLLVCLTSCCFLVLQLMSCAFCLCLRWRLCRHSKVSAVAGISLLFYARRCQYWAMKSEINWGTFQHEESQTIDSDSYIILALDEWYYILCALRCHFTSFWDVAQICTTRLVILFGSSIEIR
jgi:hypothetical protein